MTNGVPPSLSRPEAKPSRFPFSVVRWLYDWVVSFAEKPYGAWALLILAAAEASFFPIPPDVLLIALSIGAPAKSLWFAAVCTVGSLIGAAGGYFLGYEFFELIGKPIVEFYSAEEAYETARQMYQEWDVIAVAVAGFTPIPYKVITITAGAFRLNFATFLLVSAVSRAARFFLVGALIRWLGPSIKEVIDRYFNLLTIVFGVLLVGGFLILKYVI